MQTVAEFKTKNYKFLLEKDNDFVVAKQKYKKMFGYSEYEIVFVASLTHQSSEDDEIFEDCIFRFSDIVNYYSSHKL
jgi:hypothetical protein